MKNLIFITIFLFFFFSLHFSCKKSSISELTGIELISPDSLRVIDSINRATIIADSINNIIMEKIATQLGNYHIMCRLQTADIAPDTNSNSGYSPFPIDSIFWDTIALDLLEDSLAYIGIDPRQLDENTIFASLEFLRPEHVRFFSHFFLQLKDNEIKYKSTDDPYMCKCGGRLWFTRDSIFYSYANLRNSFDLYVDCSGARRN